jgi:hypothetical protein
MVNLFVDGNKSNVEFGARARRAVDIHGMSERCQTSDPDPMFVYLWMHNLVLTANVSGRSDMSRSRQSVGEPIR